MLECAEAGRRVSAFMKTTVVNDANKAALLKVVDEGTQQVSQGPAVVRMLGWGGTGSSMDRRTPGRVRHCPYCSAGRCEREQVVTWAGWSV